MIKAAELKIRNWALVDGKPTRLDALEIVFDEIVDPINPEPIVLTPEILQKAGFKSAKPNWWLSDHFNMYFEDDVYNFAYGAQDNLCKIQYAHQLQNLFYVLTGEEIKIEL